MGSELQIIFCKQLLILEKYILLDWKLKWKPSAQTIQNTSSKYT
jgi:hypothetical protein